MEAELWEALRINHIFSIMHLDIKNDNIGFSSKLKKWVFLDYGMSQIVREGLGHRTDIRYSGTMGYMSQEMMTNCLNRKPVDLYGNDAHALAQTVQISLKKKQKHLIIQNFVNDPISLPSFQQEYKTICLKFYLYFGFLDDRLQEIKQFLST